MNIYSYEKICMLIEEYCQFFFFLQRKYKPAENQSESLELLTGDRREGGGGSVIKRHDVSSEKFSLDWTRGSPVVHNMSGSAITG